MTNLAHITADEKADVISFAIEMAKVAISSDRGFVSPTAKIGTLSDWEWEKVVLGVMSGWIAERSRQAVGDRIFQEEFMLATGEIPEPYELGLAATVLSPLGELVEGMKLEDKTIGEWSREEICLFVWTAADLMNTARARNDERPEGAADGPELFMAG